MSIVIKTIIYDDLSRFGYLFSFPKSLRLLTETLLFVNGVDSVLAMFSVDDNKTGAGLAAGLAEGLTDAGPDAELLDITGLTTVVDISAETHCNVKANTIASSTDVFLVRLSIFFQLITQNVLCSLKLMNVNLFTNL